MHEASSPVSRFSAGRVSTQIVVLLAVAVFINYIDRGNLATAAPLLKGDLGLSTTQVGVVLSAFFWTYTPMLLIAGCMVERFDVHRLLAVALTVWSVATAASGLDRNNVAATLDSRGRRDWEAAVLRDDSRSARGLGRLSRAILQQLHPVFCARLVALVPGEIARIFHDRDVTDRRGRELRLRVEFRRDGLDL